MGGRGARSPHEPRDPRTTGVWRWAFSRPSSRFDKVVIAGATFAVAAALTTPRVVQDLALPAAVTVVVVLVWSLLRATREQRDELRELLRAAEKENTDARGAVLRSFAMREIEGAFHTDHNVFRITFRSANLGTVPILVQPRLVEIAGQDGARTGSEDPSDPSHFWPDQSTSMRFDLPAPTYDPRFTYRCHIHVVFWYANETFGEIYEYDGRWVAEFSMSTTGAATETHLHTIGARDRRLPDDCTFEQRAA